MADRIKNLEKSWGNRSTDARAKAMETIEKMYAEKILINFNSVHIQNGLSKNYLYKDEEIRKSIEGYRQNEKIQNQIWHKKYDKTSQLKDVVIETKNKRIAKLEEENQRLRTEVQQLRGLLYDRK